MHDQVLKNLQMAHGHVDVANESQPSRELSLVKTKIEEAMYWLARDANAKAVLINTDDVLDP